MCPTFVDVGPEGRPDTVRPVSAVVLLSGGIDSAVCLSVARRRHDRVVTTAFDYGQRNRVEVEAARTIAEHHDVELRVLTLDLPWSGSTLTGDSGATGATSYVPGRNLVFLSLAVAQAEALGFDQVYFGAGATDRTYPDSRAEFVESLQATVDLALQTGVDGRPVSIRTPLMPLSKPEVIRAGVAYGTPLHLTWSCYQTGPRPCRTCGACRHRAEAFAVAGVADPLVSD